MHQPRLIKYYNKFINKKKGCSKKAMMKIKMLRTKMYKNKVGKITKQSSKWKSKELMKIKSKLTTKINSNNQVWPI